MPCSATTAAAASTPSNSSTRTATRCWSSSISCSTASSTGPSARCSRDNKGGARGTQQILRREGGDNGDGKWVPIEGTGQKREFDAWVAEHVGLNYETFTSSVLLLQGKAEKLLDSKPEGRREVLAGIVDLERYERLHKNGRRKAQDAGRRVERA